MGYQPQAGLGFMHKAHSDALRRIPGVVIGKVIKTRDNAHTVDVVTMDGQIVRNVKVTAATASHKFGRTCMVSSDLVQPLDTPGGPVDTPCRSGTEDVYAVLSYVGGDSAMPVCTGFVYPEDGQLMGLPTFMYERWPGGHYHLVDSLEAGYEFVWSDLSYFRASPGNLGRTPLNNYDGNYQHIGGPPMGFRFFQNATGNYAELLNTGELTLLFLKAVAITLGVEGGVTLDVGTGLEITGDVSFVDKPECPSAEGGISPIATLEDVERMIGEGGGGQGGPGGGVQSIAEVYWGALYKAIGDFTTIEGYVTGLIASHTHTKSKITDLETITATPTASAVPKADTGGKIANGWLNTGTGNGLDADKVDGSHASAFAAASHTHPKSQISDLETITATPTGSAVPKADGDGKIANGWLNTGTGKGLDADTVDGSHASAFAAASHTHPKSQISDLETITETPTALCVPKAGESGKIAAGWLAAHDILTAHSYSGGAALDVFGLSAASTLARLTPSANPGAAAAILKSDASGLLETQGYAANRTPASGEVRASGDIRCGGQLRLGTSEQVIHASVKATGLSDNVATEIFTITTTNETGSNDGGAWSCAVRGLVTHAAASGSAAVSSRYFAAHFTRAIINSGTGVLSAVTEEYDDAGADAALTRSIAGAVMTVAETSEYVTSVRIAVDLTGTSISTAEVMFTIELCWQGFLTAPVLAAAGGGAS